MGTITFKGISSADLGMIVEKMPEPGRAKRRIEKWSVPGRDGALHKDEGAYDPITLKATLNAFGRATDGQIREWLSGKGDLVLSDDPTLCYRATAYAEIKESRYRTAEGKNYDSVTATFECDPYRYLTTPDTKLVNNGSFITNAGGTEALPIIIIYGSGSVNLMVGTSTVLIDDLDGYITIDCDAKNATKGTLWQGEKVRIMGGWPRLKVGQTAISWTGAVSSVSVTVNQRWL